MENQNDVSSLDRDGQNSQNNEPDPTPPTDDQYQNIDWNRTPNFHMPSQPSHRHAWIWTQGYDIEETKTSERYFLCKKCHVERRYKKHMWKVSGGTAIPLKHLKEVHNLTEKGPVAKKSTIFDAFKEPDGSLAPRDRDIVHQLVTGFNTKRFKTMLTRWIVHENIAFFHDMMLESNSSLDEHNCLPIHETIHKWIIKDFEKYKVIIEQLKMLQGWSMYPLISGCPAIFFPYVGYLYPL